MVDQVLVDYLKKYGDKYPLEDLKKQFLSKGYSEKDFNDARAEASAPVRQNFSLDSLEPTRPKGFKWMLMAGIIGLFFLFLLLFGVVSSFVDLHFDIGSSIYLLLGIVLILLILVFFYLFGFVRMSSFAKSGLLKFGAVANIIIFLILFVGSITAAVYAYSLIVQFGASFIGGSSSFSGGFSSPMTGNAVGDLTNIGFDFSSINLFSYFNTNAWIIFISAMAFFVFCIVARFCFSVGLIKSGVKFSGLAGIFDLILTLSGAVSLFFTVYAMSSPYKTVVIMSGLDPNAVMVFSGVFGLISILALLFESLSLISASRKFE